MKLYGREARIQEFLKSFALVKEQEKPQLSIISGASGVGKSAIVYDVLKRLVDRGARCITGKGDQFQQNVPYFVVVSALKQLIRQLQSDIQSHHWREKLLAALGNNGQVLVEVVPELEYIIGPQSAVPELNPTKSQNRFNTVFQRFIQACCSREHPMVIFLDDLQWANLTNLKLVVMMTDPEKQCLLVIGAYRDNEVGPNHPLTITLEKLHAGDNIQQIHLEALSARQISQFVVDTLQDPTERTRLLGQLMFQQTAGNPLHVKHLLNILCIENQLVRDKDNRIWNWQFEQLPQQDIFELISCNLAKLSPQTQHLLRRAACIGSRVPLKILAAINEVSINEISRQLEDALQIQLIVLDPETSEPTVRFPHDRIQQVIYNSIPQTTRTAMHLATGRLLQVNQQENLFTVVNQLNLGSCLLISQNEKYELAALNLKAAQQAKSAIAFESALTYIYQGLELVNNAWQHNYSLTLKIHEEIIEIEYLNHNFEQSHKFSKTALKQAITPLDQVRIYQLKIQIYIAQNQFKKAINFGLEVLEMQFEITLSQEITENFRIEIEDLANLPIITDSYKLSALEILADIGDVASIADPEIASSIALAEVHFCALYGNSPLAACAYIDYAAYLCGSEEIDLGHQYKELAFRLLEQFNAKQFYAKVITISNVNVTHWRNHLIKTLKPLRKAIKNGIEIGDFEFSGYAAINYCTHTFFVGLPLAEVEKDYLQQNDLLAKLNLKFHISGNAILHQMVVNLIEESSESSQLKGEIFDESEMIPIFHRYNSLSCLFFTYLAKGILSYLFGDYTRSIESFKEADKFKNTIKGFIVFAIHDFYYTLACLSHYLNTPNPQKTDMLTQARSRLKRLAKWARHAPMNFQHKHDTIAAVLAWVTGKHKESEQFFQKAIEGAKQNGYLQEEALAHELLGEFSLSQGEKQIGEQSLIEALNCYERWGAMAKVNNLKRNYPHLCVSKTVESPNQAFENFFFASQSSKYKLLLELCSEIYFDDTNKKLIIICSTDELAEILIKHSRSVKKPKSLEIRIEIRSPQKNYTW